jgi:hypothetical protein
MKHDSGDGGPNLTIVGGQPRPARRRGGFTTRVPVGIEVVLHKAAREPELRALLLRDRDAGLRSAGFTLAETELAALRAAPPAVLAAMIDRLNDPARPQTRLFGIVAAAAASLAAGTASMGCGGTIANAGVLMEIDSGADAEAGFPSAGVRAPVDAGLEIEGGIVSAGVRAPMDAGIDVDSGVATAGVRAPMDAAIDVDSGIVSAGVRAPMDAAIDVDSGVASAGARAPMDAAIDVDSGIATAGVRAPTDASDD